MSLGAVVLDLVLRVAVLASLGWALVRWVPGVSARLRHRWAMGLLVVSTWILPLASLLPKLEVAVFPAASGMASPAGLEFEGSALGVLGSRGLRNSLELEVTGRPGVGDRPASATRSSGDGLPIWAWVWILGACVVATRGLGSHLAVRRLARELPEVDARAWKELVDHLRQRVGLRRPVRLMALEGPVSPAAFGLVRPSVILPRSAAAWRGEGLRQVLLHELAHLRRRDPLQRCIAELCCACFWFLPMVWGLERRMRVESERACDDLVLASGTSASGYAAVLLGLQQRLRMERALLPSLACLVRKSEFEGRLDAILDPGRARGVDSGVAGALGGLVLGVAVLGLVTLRPVRSEATPSAAIAQGNPETTPVASFRQGPSVPTTTDAAEVSPGSSVSEGPSIEETSRPGTLDAVLTTAVPGVGFAGATASEEPELQNAHDRSEPAPTDFEAPLDGLDLQELLLSGSSGVHVISLDQTQSEEPFDCERFDALAAGAKPTEEEVRQVLQLAGVDLGGLLEHAQVRVVPVLVPATGANRRDTPVATDSAPPPGDRGASVPSPSPTERRTRPLGTDPLQSPSTVELWARERHKDYLRATYNFGFATRDDREATRNNWDIQLKGYRAPYEFDVNMTGGDRSRIADLGQRSLGTVTLEPRFVEALGEECVRVEAGHSYLIHTVDSRSDYWTRLHVFEVTDEGTCRFEWQMLLDETPPSVRRHP